MLVELLELTDEEMDGYRASPLWPTRLAAAGTIPRECRAEEDWVYEPGQFDAIGAATLFLTGSESVPDVKVATDRAVEAIPGAEVSVLRGPRALRPQDGSRDGRRPRQPFRHEVTATPVSSSATR